MTIVIPYKSEVHGGLELKFALRSIEKNLSGWDKIFLIGTNLPPFRYGIGEKNDGKLRDLEKQCPDYSGRKEYSVYQKLLAASDDPLISENFIYWNDDHFLLKPLHVKDFKYWHNGPLEARIGHVYNRELQKTQNTLNLFGKWDGLLNYDIHVPIVFNKKTFKQVFENLTEEVCIKSLYTNQIFRQSEFMEDCKIVGAFSKSEIVKKIAGRLFFSTNAICSPTVEILEELFPQKSKFEI